MTEQIANPSADVENPKKEESLGDIAKTALIAIFLALLIRTFLFEPFNIPSGSMIPNLLVGDYLFISKYSYGYSRYSFPLGLGGFEGRIAEHQPHRGDVVVFKLPSNTSIDYIKRVVGLPGETVQMIAGRLYIDGQLIPREQIGMAEYDDELGSTVKVKEYVETLPGGVRHTIYEKSDDEALDNTEKYTVPAGHYFMMGDNRDNSRDSRVLDGVGYVPFDNFLGRAELTFFSTNGSARFYEVWKWPWSIRYSHLFKRIGNGESLKVKEAPAK